MSEENKDMNPPAKDAGFFSKLAPGARGYIFFCIIVASAMAIANHVGFFPTYGIFSGENSMHSSYHGAHYYGGGYGIHGK